MVNNDYVNRIKAIRQRIAKEDSRIAVARELIDDVTNLIMSSSRPNCAINVHHKNDLMITNDDELFDRILIIN